jgi:hypothetical protein
LFGSKIDFGGLMGLLNMHNVTHQAMKDAARDLTAMTHAKTVELANSRLNTRRKMFIEALSMTQLNDSTWFIQLDAKARWIDDGMPPHSMLDDLLKSPKAKVSKDGHRYVVVPFHHGPGKGITVTPAQGDLINTIRAEMKRNAIPFGKIERHNDGSAKLGKLHSFNILDAPKKTHEGVGQGKGPVGKVRQGPTGIPFLQGVNVYQRKQADGSVRRDIMTFRIASERHRGQGRWEHPGLEPKRIFEDVAEWAWQTWEREIAPQVMEKIAKSL